MTNLTDPLKIGYVYKLYCEELNDFYIGSTIRTLKLRLNEHKSNIRTKKSKLYFFDYVENLKMELIEIFEFENRKDLIYRERYYFEKLKPKINNCCPIRHKGEYDKLYYRQNRTKINNRRGQHYECEFCFKLYSLRHKARHRKSKYCISKQNNN